MGNTIIGRWAWIQSLGEGHKTCSSLPSRAVTYVVAGVASATDSRSGYDVPSKTMRPSCSSKIDQRGGCAARRLHDMQPPVVAAAVDDIDGAGNRAIDTRLQTLRVGGPRTTPAHPPPCATNADHLLASRRVDQFAVQVKLPDQPPRARSAVRSVTLSLKLPPAPDVGPSHTGQAGSASNAKVRPGLLDQIIVSQFTPRLDSVA